MLRTKLYRSTEIKALDGTRVQATVSDESEDREGDIIRASGWNLDSFNKHPVLVASHDYYSLRSQIGEWEDMDVKGKKLVGVARYYVGEGNEEADWAYNLASKGKAAYSVGFIPEEYKQRVEGDWRSGWEFTKQELLEVSHVTIPSNRNALQLMAAKGTGHALLDGLVKEVLAEDVSTTIETKDMGLCMMPDCDAQAGAAIPMCKDCLQKAMSRPEPMAMSLAEMFAAAERSPEALEELHQAMHSHRCSLGIGSHYVDLPAETLEPEIEPKPPEARSVDLMDALMRGIDEAVKEAR